MTMAYILTLVASDTQSPVSDIHIRKIKNFLTQNDTKMACDPTWIAEGKAIDLSISNRLSDKVLDQIRSALDDDKIDIFIVEEQNRRKRLLLADMDSTIVTNETLDELAAYAGIKDQISAITTRAMEGHLDFKEALHERVSLLKGLPSSALHDVLSEIKLSEGAEKLINTMRTHGCTCVLVSGGFTFFTAAIAEQVGFEHHHGNELEIENDQLTGRVIEPILDKDTKLELLKNYIKKLGITESDCLTIGDGANDIPMLKAAGLGVGYKPKSVVIREISNIIRHGDLTTALYVQGYGN